MSRGLQRWRWGDPLQVLVEALERHLMLVVPTESSYGLAVDPRDSAAVSAVFACKGRPRDRPLPVILGAPEQLRQIGGDPEAPELLTLAAMWPGPLSVVVPIEHPLPATAGRRSVAVRVPGHRRLRQLLRALGRPLTATSANPSGERPASSPQMLRAFSSDWPGVLVDDGVLPGGPPSTMVEASADGVRVLREGAIPIRQLRRLIAMPVFSETAAEIPADDWPTSR